MKAMVLKELGGPLRLEDVLVPQPGPAGRRHAAEAVRYQSRVA